MTATATATKDDIEQADKAMRNLLDSCDAEIQCVLDADPSMHDARRVRAALETWIKVRELHAAGWDASAILDELA